MILTAENGRSFEVEQDVNPWDLKAGDEVFYSSNHLGYASILAVGRTETIAGTCGQYLRTPVVAFWDPFMGASEWLTSHGVFMRIIREVSA